jgi:hypothetical protein
VTLQKHFLHPSLVIYFFLIHKTERGTANRWGTTNSKPSGPIIMIGQSKTGISSQIISITLFCRRCTLLLRFCYQPQKVDHICRGKTISWAKPAYVHFSSSDFNVKGHILSTDGDALRWHNGGGLPDLTIVQNPHAHCANHENHNVVEFARVQCCRGGSLGACLLRDGHSKAWAQGCSHT